MGNGKGTYTNKYVLITGASTGIGYALAKEFALHGWNLILVSQNKSRLKEAANLLKNRFKNKQMDIKVFVQDLSVIGAAKQLYENIKNTGLNVEVLVNNAGVGMSGPFEAFDTGLEEEMLTLNMLTPVALAREFVKDNMRPSDRGKETCLALDEKCDLNDLEGIRTQQTKRLTSDDTIKKIVNIASNGAFQPGPFISSYYASKSFLLNWSLAVREELKEKEIEVITVCPGATVSRFAQKAEKRQNPYSMSAERTARIIYKGMISGKRLIIPGIGNKLALLCPIYYRSLAVAKMQKKLMQ